MSTQSNTRQKFIKANPGIRLRGYDGYWYRCAHCGREGAKIPDDCKGYSN